MTINDAATTAYPFVELRAAGLIVDRGDRIFALTETGREMVAGTSDIKENGL